MLGFDAGDELAVASCLYDRFLVAASGKVYSDDFKCLYGNLPLPSELLNDLPQGVMQYKQWLVVLAKIKREYGSAGLECFGEDIHRGSVAALRFVYPNSSGISPGEATWGSDDGVVVQFRVKLETVPSVGQIPDAEDSLIQLKKRLVEQLHSPNSILCLSPLKGKLLRRESMIRLLSDRIVELYELTHSLRASQPAGMMEPGYGAAANVAGAGFLESAKRLFDEDRVKECLNLVKFWVQHPGEICDVLLYEALIVDELKSLDDIHTPSLEPILNNALKCGSRKIVDVLIRLGVRTHWSDYSDAMYKNYGLIAHCL